MRSDTREGDAHMGRSADEHREAEPHGPANENENRIGGGGATPDRRVRRTERAIAEAYVTLRARGGRITVKELCELADINKTTFYQHYRDLPDLRRSLERKLVEGFVDDIAHPDYVVSDNQSGMFEVTRAFARRRELIARLYTSEQLPALARRVAEEFEHRIYELRPDLAHTRERRVLLTFLVRGSFEAFFTHLDEGDEDELVRIINNVRQCLARAYVPLGKESGADEA